MINIPGMATRSANGTQCARLAQSRRKAVAMAHAAVAPHLRLPGVIWGTGGGARAERRRHIAMRRHWHTLLTLSAAVSQLRPPLGRERCIDVLDSEAAAHAAAVRPRPIRAAAGQGEEGARAKHEVLVVSNRGALCWRWHMLPPHRASVFLR